MAWGDWWKASLNECTFEQSIMHTLGPTTRIVEKIYLVVNIGSMMNGTEIVPIRVNEWTVWENGQWITVSTQGHQQYQLSNWVCQEREMIKNSQSCWEETNNPCEICQ